jgi:molybdenum cofactor cytidylyltransferase
VVPGATTILVPIAGVNAIGQTLEESHVHRSELVAALAQQPPGSVITPQTLARVLSHPEGGAKQRPAGARLVPMLNKTDTDAAMRQACEAAGIMLAGPGVDSVMISSMKEEPPIREAWTHVAGIVLAAGKSSRYGGIKQTLPWNNTTFVAHSVRLALDAGLDPVIAVVGHQADVTEKSLAGLPVKLVYNPDYESGQSTSLRKGMEELPSYISASVFLLADQPLVTADIVKEIVSAHRRSFAPACVPLFEGKRGNPVLFDRSLFHELRQLRGDTGGRELLEKHWNAIATVPASRAVLVDIDSPEDYERLKIEYRRQETEFRRND